MSARHSDPASRSVWIGEGPSQCTYCLQGYSVEVEVHCVFCDHPGCPHCMVRVTERTVFGCPHCPHEEDASDRASENAASGEGP